MNFKELHKQESPILICNVWDVASAKAAKKLNFQAIGTSSGAIATMLGYNDGEEISFKELAYIVERINKSVDLPLTVDLEAGYSRQPSEIAAHIIRLANLGVIGVNLEDSIVEQGKRKLINVLPFSAMLKEVCSILKQQNQNVFINVRTDTFLLNIPNALDETIVRAASYHKAGANGLFVPCIEKEEDIARIVKATKLPLNVMCMPNLPAFDLLEKLGVKRISMGNFVFNKTTNLLETELKQILQNKSFKSLFH